MQARSFTRPSNDATQLGFFSISSFQILPDLIRVWFINFTMDTMEPMTNSADNANPIQDDLHHRLNFYFETMSKPWTSPLKFSMHTGLMCAQDNSAKEIDICSFIQGNLPESCLCDFAYFNRLQFPPSEDQTKVSPSLHSALTFAARQAGFHLKGNGSSYTKKNLLSRKKFPRGSTSPFGSITYICGRYDRYASQNKDNTHQFTTLDPRAQNFRQVTLHNNQKGNTRGSDGKKGPRKSHSTKAITTRDTCKFRITVFWDSIGYYIQRGVGYTIHCQHMRRFAKDIPLSVRRWGESVQQEVGQLSKGRITPASLRNYLRNVHGIVASREQCRYASKVYDADNE